jgi:hypothetical protein
MPDRYRRGAEAAIMSAGEREDGGFSQQSVHLTVIAPTAQG